MQHIYTVLCYGFSCLLIISFVFFGCRKSYQFERINYYLTWVPCCRNLEVVKARHSDTPLDIISSEKPSPQTTSLLSAPQDEHCTHDVATQWEDLTEISVDFDPGNKMPGTSGPLSMQLKLPPEKCVVVTRPHAVHTDGEDESVNRHKCNIQ